MGLERRHPGRPAKRLLSKVKTPRLEGKLNEGRGKRERGMAKNRSS